MNMKNINQNKSRYGWLRVIILLMMIGGLLQFPAPQTALAADVDIELPDGSSTDNDYILKVLPNGNILVSDPNFDDGDKENVGAVHLYDGETLERINTLKGSTAEDKVGFSDNPSGVSGIEITQQGDKISYIVVSPSWDLDDGKADAGAVTFCDGETGCAGADANKYSIISASNSLVGSSVNDKVGYEGAVVLSDGDYVVSSPYWASEPGAVTWCSGTDGCTGEISVENSLVGNCSTYMAGYYGVTALDNGNFVVSSSNSQIGAVTWCEGAAGKCIGEADDENSLIGGDTDFQNFIGLLGVVALKGNQYVVVSPRSGNPSSGNSLAGAVTFCDADSADDAKDCRGDKVTQSNSLYGNNDKVYIGSIDAGYRSGVQALSNGTYVVVSSYWDDTDLEHKKGAVTWCDPDAADGAAGDCVGEAVSSTNSLVGPNQDDCLGRIGSTELGLTELDDGNFVIASPSFNKPPSFTDVGAVTWCSGTAGCTAGAVTAANSLVGSTASDEVGSAGVIALNDGKYVVSSPLWNNTDPEVIMAGAVTFCAAVGGCKGTVASQSTNLIGSAAGEQIGYYGSRMVGDGN